MVEDILVQYYPSIDISSVKSISGKSYSYDLYGNWIFHSNQDTVHFFNALGQSHCLHGPSYFNMAQNFKLFRVNGVSMVCDEYFNQIIDPCTGITDDVKLIMHILWRSK